MKACSQLINAMFIGEDGSMGFRNGKFYSVKVSSGCYKGKFCLWVYCDGIACSYYGFEALANNWSL